MLNAQQWLDTNYPAQRRSQITKLDISYEKLSGSLDLASFANLKELHCRDNKLTELKNLPSNLEILRCQNNQLTNLNLTNCPNLIKLNCHDNLLADLNFLLNLNNEKLVHLNIGDNNLPASDLNFLRRFVNLETLWLGNSYETKIGKNIYNRFTGSLKPLQDLTRLNSLGIINTDLDDGWEYLPDSIKEFYCSTIDYDRQNAKVQKIIEELEKFGDPREESIMLSPPCYDFSNNLKAWKLDWSQKKIQQLEEQNDQISKELETVKRILAEMTINTEDEEMEDSEQDLTGLTDEERIQLLISQKRLEMEKLIADIQKHKRLTLGQFSLLNNLLKKTNLTSEQSENGWISLRLERLGGKLTDEEVIKVQQLRIELNQLEAKLESLQKGQLQSQTQVNPWRK